MKFKPLEPILAEELDLVLHYRTLLRLYPDAVLEPAVVDRLDCAVSRYELLDRNDPFRSNSLYHNVEQARVEILVRLFNAPDSAYDFNDKEVVAKVLEGMLDLAGRISLGRYRGQITDQYLQDCRRAIGKLPLFRNHRRIRRLYVDIAFKLNAAYETVKNRHASQISDISLEYRLSQSKTA